MKPDTPPEVPGRRASRWRRVRRVRRVPRRPKHGDARRRAQKRPGRRRRVLVVTALALLALLIAGIIYFLLRPPAAAADVVRREDVVLVLALTGEIDARTSVQVLPEVSGRIVELTVSEGATVTAGQVLARLDADESVAQLAQAIDAVNARRVELEQARREQVRAERLFSGGAIAQQELEQARLEVERGEQDVAQLEAAVQERRAQLGNYVLRAPMDAVVLERPVDPGQVVGPETLIYDLAEVGGRRVEALVDERYITDLYPGLPATVTPIGEDEVYQARISYVSDGIDPETGAATVRLQFSGPPPALPFRLSVDINVVAAEYADALTVAREAVIAPSEVRSWVYVVEDGVVVPREVSIIDWPAERVVVRAGLEAGEEVVLTPRQVEPGQRVRPRPVEP